MDPITKMMARQFAQQAVDIPELTQLLDAPMQEARKTNSDVVTLREEEQESLQELLQMFEGRLEQCKCPGCKARVWATQRLIEKGPILSHEWMVDTLTQASAVLAACYIHSTLVGFRGGAYFRASELAKEFEMPVASKVFHMLGEVVTFITENVQEFCDESGQERLSDEDYRKLVENEKKIV